MSWDIVLFNSTEKIISPEDLDETKLVPTNFCEIFESGFGSIIQDDDHRSIRGNNYSIEYFTDEELTSNMLINLYGEDAIYPIINLAIKNNWQIFDTGLGEMINLENPTKNGYENFQVYLNQVMNNHKN
jgi:hypothetical protein